MKKLIALTILVAMVTGCSSARVRNKWTDPEHRVMILADHVPEETYVSIQTSLIDTNRFFVVDRARGFKAIKQEQDMIHKRDGERFDDPEKYSWFGKMYSVGAVIVPSEHCMPVPGVFSNVKRIDCRQYLAAIDTSTGQVIAAVQNLAEGENRYEKPSWDETVGKLVDAFPKDWESNTYDRKMTEYRLATAENARRAKESLAKEQIEKTTQVEKAQEPQKQIKADK